MEQNWKGSGSENSYDRSSDTQALVIISLYATREDLEKENRCGIVLISFSFTKIL